MKIEEKEQKREEKIVRMLEEAFKRIENLERTLQGVLAGAQGTRQE